MLMAYVDHKHYRIFVYQQILLQYDEFIDSVVKEMPMYAESQKWWLS